VHQKDLEGSVLSVKETTDYRWFEYGGDKQTCHGFDIDLDIVDKIVEQ